MSKEHARHATDVTEHVTVAILGGGIAGLGLGLRLASQGKDFRLLERASDVGGTWRDNHYPGVECDIPAHLYSFSFRPNSEWTHLFATGEDIQQYLRECASTPGLAENIRLGVAVTAATWDDAHGVWQINTDSGRLTADVFVVAAGRLSEMRMPEVQGLESFDGPVFHSSNWPTGLDLSGKRVAIAGTGASAIQIMPRIAKDASHTYIYQRSAPWILPRGNRRYTDRERRALRLDPVRTALRDEQFRDAEAGYSARAGNADAIAALRARALAHLHQQVSDPALRSTLTPNYEIGCKRVLLSDDYYPAAASARVSVIPSALDRTVGRATISASGESHDVDVVVLATGFRAAEAPFARMIRGRGGELLSDHWSEGMTSFASSTVSGFPNMFILDGPNASLGHNSAVYMIEAQIEYFLRVLGSITAGDVVEPSAEAERAYTAHVDELAKTTVWMTGGCSSWYRDERSGRLTLLWPGTAESFRDSLERLELSGYVRTRRPRRTNRAERIL